jgi:predicted nucleic acid-binding Zn ribbon protein
MNRKARPTAVSEVLNSILTKKEINSAKNLEFLSSWSEVVGISTAKVSKPSELKKGILSVKVIDATWAQELAFREANIIEKLCEMGYGGVVSKIKFIVGSPLDFK